MDKFHLNRWSRGSEIFRYTFITTRRMMTTSAPKTKKPSNIQTHWSIKENQDRRLQLSGGKSKQIIAMMPTLAQCCWQKTVPITAYKMKRLISLSKLLLYKTRVLSVLIYFSETRDLSKKNYGPTTGFEGIRQKIGRFRNLYNEESITTVQLWTKFGLVDYRGRIT